MTETASHVHAAAQAQIAATLLKLGRPFDLASLMLTAAALTVLALAPPSTLACAALLLAVAAGVSEHFYAMRTAFDAPVFAAWARHWQTGENDPDHDLAAFDRALADNQLRAAPAGPLRPLSERIAGARRLLKRQGLFLLLQLAAWLAAIAIILRPL